MNSINVRTEVEQALQSEWRTFAEQHPRLAAVVDQMLLVEEATACLLDDPQFRQAMEQAAAAGLGAGALADAIQRFARDWIRRLL